MDQKELQEKIALFYSKLPPNVQEVFSSMKWLETLKTISQKYLLSEKQKETLGTETTLVLLGIIHLVEYEEALTNELGLSRDNTEKMLAEIQESIIKTIRPQLLEAFEENKKSETKEIPETDQKLDPRLEKLPKEIENVIKESNYQAILYNITRGYNLSVPQMDTLEKAIINLISGVIRPEEFENYLENNLKLPLETVKKITNEINEKIFLKIRELLKQTNTTKNEERNIMNSAGIEIIHDLPEMPKTQLVQTEKLELTTPIEKREDILKKIEKQEEVHTVRSEPLENASATVSLGRPASNGIHPILGQKLLGSVQIGMVKTDHSLQNLSQNSNTTKSNNTPKIDPYREIPE